MARSWKDAPVDPPEHRPKDICGSWPHCHKPAVSGGYCAPHFASVEKIRLELRYVRRKGDPTKDEIIAAPAPGLTIRHVAPEPKRRGGKKPMLVAAQQRACREAEHRARIEAAGPIDFRARILAALADGALRPGELALACEVAATGYTRGYAEARAQLLADLEVIAFTGPTRYALAGTEPPKRRSHIDWQSRILAALADGPLESAALAAACGTPGRGGSYHRACVLLDEAGQLQRSPGGDRGSFVYSLPIGTRCGLVAARRLTILASNSPE